MDHAGLGYSVILHLAVVAAGMAAAELSRAAEHASACAAANGQLEAAWKLLGDIYLAYHAITPLPPLDTSAADSASDPAASAFTGYACPFPPNRLESKLHMPVALTWALNH